KTGQNRTLLQRPQRLLHGRAYHLAMPRLCSLIYHATRSVGGRDSAWSGAKASARLPALTLAGTWPAGVRGWGEKRIVLMPTKALFVDSLKPRIQRRHLSRRHTIDERPKAC